MARKRASMREGPLAELFRATEAAQRAQGEQTGSETAPTRAEPTRPEPVQPVQPELPIEPRPEDVTLEATVEHVYEFELSRPEPVERRPEPEPVPPPVARAPQPVAPPEPPAVVPAPEPVPEVAPAIEHEPMAEPDAALTR